MIIFERNNYWSKSNETNMINLKLFCLEIFEVNLVLNLCIFFIIKILLRIFVDYQILTDFHDDTSSRKVN